TAFASAIPCSVAQFFWNVTTSSSAIRMMGGPPFEILWPCASASRTGCDAAHACKDSAEGKWISAVRWNAGVPEGAPTILVNTAFVAPAALKIFAAMGMCSALYARSNAAMSLGIGYITISFATAMDCLLESVAQQARR